MSASPSTREMATSCTAHWDDPEMMRINQLAYQDFLAKNRAALEVTSTPSVDASSVEPGAGEEGEAIAGMKRERAVTMTDLEERKKVKMTGI